MNHARAVCWSKIAGWFFRQVAHRETRYVAIELLSLLLSSLLLFFLLPLALVVVVVAPVVFVHDNGTAEMKGSTAIDRRRLVQAKMSVS